MSLRALAMSLNVANFITTSSSPTGVGGAPVPRSARNAPAGRDADWAMASGGAEEVVPWLGAACWRGEGISTVSVEGLCDRPPLEGEGLLRGEPPAKAATEDCTQQTRMSVGGRESRTGRD